MMTYNPWGPWSRPRSIRKTIDKLDINQVEAADLCGVGHRTFRAWVDMRRVTRAPWTAVLVMRLMEADPANVERVRHWAKELE